MTFVKPASAPLRVIPTMIPAVPPKLPTSTDMPTNGFQATDAVDPVHLPPMLATQRDVKLIDDDDDSDDDDDDGGFVDPDAEPTPGFGDDLDDDDDGDDFDDIDEDDFDDDFDDDFEEELEDDYEIEIDDEISTEFGLNTAGDKDDELDDDLDDFDDFDKIAR